MRDGWREGEGRGRDGWREGGGGREGGEMEGERTGREEIENGKEGEREGDKVY